MFEILVVMGIIAIVAAFIVPRVGNTITNLKIRSAVRRCSAVLRYSRSIAITIQKEQRVSFILKEDEQEKDSYRYHKVKRVSADKEDEDSYDYDEQIQVDTGGELKEEEKTIKLDTGSISWRDNPDDEWRQEGEYEIIFTPRGFNSGGEIRFSLSAEKRGYILRVDPVTGRVKISSGED